MVGPVYDVLSLQSGLTALVIDDYGPSRYTTAHALRRAGFLVYEAKTAREGIELAEQRLPDVILLDVNLPDIHGFQVCEQLKNAPPTQHIPIVQITQTSRGDRHRSESIRAGADAFIEEPIADTELVRIVEVVITKNKRR